MTRLISCRIKITGPVEVEVSRSKPEKSKKKWSKMFKFGSDEESLGAGDTKESVELDEGVVGGDGGVAEQEAEPVEEKPRILMVRTENLTHHPFQQTQELKVSLATPTSVTVLDCGLGVTCRLFLLRSSKPSETL